MPSRPTVTRQGLKFRATPIRRTTHWNPFYIESIHPTFRVKIKRVCEDVSVREKNGITFTIGLPTMAPGTGRELKTVQLNTLHLDAVGDTATVELPNVDVAQPGQSVLYMSPGTAGGRSIYSYNVFTVGSMVLTIVGAALLVAAQWAIQEFTSGDTTIVLPESTPTGN